MAKEESNAPHIVYDPASAPIRGLASYKSSLQVPPGSGFYKELQNERWGDNQILTSRLGSVSGTSSAIQSASTVRGMEAISFQGVNGTIVSAFQTNAMQADGTYRTSVYVTSDPTNFGTAVTPSSGLYGDCRLATASGVNHDYDPVFAVAYDRFTAKDQLIVQNGYDYPKVYNGTSCAPHIPITPPQITGGWYAEYNPASYFIMGHASVSGTSVKWTMAPVTFSRILGGSKDDYTQISSTVTSGFSGSKATVFLGGGIASYGSQFIITVSGTFAGVTDFTNIFKVALSDGSTTTTIYDPSASGGTSGLSLVAGDPAASLTHLCYAIDSFGTPPTTPDRVIFTAVDPDYVASGNLSIAIYGMCAGGYWPTNTEQAISYYGPVSLAESAEQVLPNRTGRLQDAGCSAKMCGNATWPFSDSLCLQPTHHFYVPSQGAGPTYANGTVPQGTSQARVYAKLPGENDYSYVTYYTIATGSTWTPTPSVGINAFTLTSTPGVATPTARLLWLTAPGAFAEAMPIGRSMAVTTGNRLAVGARSDTQDSFPRVCLSRSGSPFRFMSAPDLTDSTTAYEDAIPNESIQAFVSSAASTFAGTTTYVFTDQAIWLLDVSLIGNPFFLRRVASIGTGAPRSIVEHRGRIYFFDTNLQVRVLAGSMDRPISLGWINDILTAIPQSRTSKIVGVWYNFRYYLFYTSSGSLNDKCLVYSENANSLQGGWESDDKLPFAGFGEAACLQKLTNASNYGGIGTPVFLTLGSDLKCYKYETGTTDLGNWIPTVVTTGDLQHPGWSGLAVDRLMFLTDPVYTTISSTVTYKPGFGTSISHATLSGGSPYDWVISAVGTPSGTALGPAASLSFSVNLPGGTAIHGIRMEVDGRLDEPRPTR